MKMDRGFDLSLPDVEGAVIRSFAVLMSVIRLFTFAVTWFNAITAGF